MGLLNEFKGFISNGSVLDLTVGVITGAAFSKVVSSFTDDIVMPSVALLKNTLQQVPGANAVSSVARPEALTHAVKLAPAAVGSGAAVAPVALAAGDSTAVTAHAGIVAAAAPASFSEGLATIGFANFVGALIYFLIISLVIILVVKVANRFRKPTEVEIINEQNLEPMLAREEALLTEIRDALLRGR